MKKILSLLLVATLIFSFAAFVACQEIPEIPDTETTAPEGTDGTEGAGTEQEETPLDAAVEYVRQLYKDTTSTPLDYTVATSVQVAGVAYSITWSVDTDKITVTPGENGTATVDLPEKAAEDLAYVLTATVADAAGATKSISFNRTVPKFAVNTWAEYFAAESGATGLVIEGVVTGIVSKTVGATNNCIFVQDTDEQGGYYVYGMTDDPVTLGIEIGMTVRVSGDKDIYNGTHEIKNAAVEILSTEKTPVTPIDLTEAYKAAADTKAAELVNLQGALVTLKGVEITTVGDNGYHNFTLAGKETYMRISGSTCAISPAEQTAYTALHTANRGNSADVTGIVSVYNGKFYLVPVVSANTTLYNITQPERTDAQKAEFELSGITVDGKITSDTVLTLPTVGTEYTNVTITWASNNAAAVVDGGKVTITVPDTATEIVLTATAVCGAETKTAEFKIALSKELTSIADAIAMGAAKEHNTYTEDKYLVAGVITSIDNDKYGNMKITDENGNILTIYGTYSADGTTRYDAMTTKPVAGDYVVVLGVIGQYSGTAQVKNGWIQSYTSKTSIADAVTEGNKYEKNTYSTDKYLVSGTVKEIQNSQYGNIVIEDAAGNSILVYGTYSATGADRFDKMTKQPAVGDTVTVYGVVGFYSAAQLKNAWIVEIQAATGGETGTETGTETETESNTETETGTETETESNTETETGKETGGETGENTTASKTIAELIVSEGWTNATTKQEFKLDANVTVKVDGGNNTGKAYNNDHIRIYATDTPAGTLTFTVSEGYELVSIKISTVEGTYAFLCIGEDTADISNVVTAVSGSSVVVNSVKNGDNGKQARVTAIEVVYKAK